MSLLIFNREGQ